MWNISLWSCSTSGSSPFKSKRIVTGSSAFAYHVDASSDIAELEPSSARHMVAAFALLNPEITAGSLLERGTFDELVEGPVLRRVSVEISVLFASDPLVPVHSTEDTIGLVAESSIEPLVLPVAIPLEDETAVGRRSV